MKRRKFLKTSLSYGAAAGANVVFLEKGIPVQGATEGQAFFLLMEAAARES